MRNIAPLPSVLLAVVCTVATIPAADAANNERRLLTTQDASGNLDGWKSFCEDPAVKTGDVWQLAGGVLLCKGAPLGYIYTDTDYASFVLKLEWRWPPGAKPGNGGVLLRTTGRHKIWPRSLEAQINTGSAGDFWGLDGYPLTGPPARSKSLAHPQFGKLTNLKKTQAVENPPGQWNQYEIIVDGDTVSLKINGQTVNKATGCDQTPGRICLTAEGDAIQFRNVRLTPLAKR